MSARQIDVFSGNSIQGRAREIIYNVAWHFQKN